MAEELSPDRAFQIQSSPAQDFLAYRNDVDPKQQARLDTFLKDMRKRAETAGLHNVQFVTSRLMFEGSSADTASAVSSEGTQYIILKPDTLSEALSSDRKMEFLTDSVSHEMGHLYYGDGTAEGKARIEDNTERKKAEVRADLFSGGVMGTGKPESIIASHNDFMSRLVNAYNGDHPGRHLPTVTPLTENEQKLMSDWSSKYDKRYPSAAIRNEALTMEIEAMKEYEAQHGKPKTQSDREKENAAVIDTVLSKIDLNKQITGVPEYDLLHDVDIKAGRTTPQAMLEAEFKNDPEAKRRLNEIIAAVQDKAKADGITNLHVLVAPTGSPSAVSSLASDTSREGNNYVIIDSNTFKAALSSDQKTQRLIAGEFHELGHLYDKDNSVEGNKRHDIPNESQKAELRADLFSGGPLGNGTPALMEAALKEFLASKIPEYNKVFAEKLPTEKPLTQEQLKLASNWMESQNPFYPSFATRIQVLEMENQALKNYETEHGAPKTQKDKERENTAITTEIMQQVEKLNLIPLPLKEAESAPLPAQSTPAQSLQLENQKR